MEFADVVRRRRMVRNFEERPVDEETITRILELAQRNAELALARLEATLGTDHVRVEELRHKLIVRIEQLLLGAALDNLAFPEHRDEVSDAPGGTEVWDMPDGTQVEVSRVSQVRTLSLGGGLSSGKRGQAMVAVFLGVVFVAAMATLIMVLAIWPGEATLAHTAEERVERAPIESTYAAFLDLLEHGPG